MIQLTEQEKKILNENIKYGLIFDAVAVYLEEYYKQNPQMKQRRKDNIRYLVTRMIPKLKELDSVNESIRRQINAESYDVP